MINEQRVQRAASKAARDAVCLEEERLLNGNSLTLWRGKDNMPAHLVAVFEYGNEVFVTTRSFADFEAMLRYGQPSFDDVETIAWLVKKAGPGPRSVLQDLDDVDAEYQAVWHAPSSGEEGVSLFCNNYSSGRVEHLLVHRNCTVELRDVGPGQILELR